MREGHDGSAPLLGLDVAFVKNIIFAWPVRSPRLILDMHVKATTAENKNNTYPTTGGCVCNGVLGSDGGTRRESGGIPGNGRLLILYKTYVYIIHMDYMYYFSIFVCRGRDRSPPQKGGAGPKIKY